MTTKTEDKAYVPVAAVPDVDFDLDALLTAKAGGDGYHNQKTVKLGGEIYTVSAKIPVYVAGLLNEGRITDGLRLWLGDEQTDRISTVMNEDDMSDIFEHLYGAKPGE